MERITLGIGGFLARADASGPPVPVDIRLSYDPTLVPLASGGGRAVYAIADPDAVVEIGAVALPAPDITLEVADDLDVRGAGLLFVDLLGLRLDGPGGDPYVLEVEPVTRDLDLLDGTGLPRGPFDIADIGASTLTNRLFRPALGEDFLDFEITALALGPGAGRLTTGEARDVAALYEIGLDRNGAIDGPGLNFWIDRREAGLSERDLAARFLDSEEFAARYGEPDTLSDRDLVERFYLNALGRTPDEGGFDFWTAALARPGFGRAELLAAFAFSEENRAGLDILDRLIETDPGTWDFAG